MLRGEIVVVGGLTARRASRRRGPTRTRRRPAAGGACPICPSPSTTRSSPRTAAASTSPAATAGRLGAGERLRTVFAFDGAGWRALPRMPEPRAAGGAAVVGGRLYVVGGVGAAGLARRAFALDLRTRPLVGRAGADAARASRRRRAAGGRIYALGGRRAGYDTNVATFESWTPGARSGGVGSPTSRGRAGAPAPRSPAAALVSVGGEEPAGTIALGVRVRTSRAGAGAGCPTCRRRATASASSRSGRRVYAHRGRADARPHRQRRQRVPRPSVRRALMTPIAVLASRRLRGSCASACAEHARRGARRLDHRRLARLRPRPAAARRRSASARTRRASGSTGRRRSIPSCGSATAASTASARTRSPRGSTSARRARRC